MCAPMCNIRCHAGDFSFLFLSVSFRLYGAIKATRMWFSLCVRSLRDWCTRTAFPYPKELPFGVTCGKSHVTLKGRCNTFSSNRGMASLKQLNASRIDCRRKL